MNLENNSMFQLAADLVNKTRRNIFLTGKAGTGKTTFLKYIRENCSKNSIVVAPTGVAAMNAGGVTMHTMFQLPFYPYTPEETILNSSYTSIDRYSLLRTLRMNSKKIELLKKLELLIIDEVSMLRADLMDATDDILRHVRGNRREPFGGIQVLLIGDLFQLPPVYQNEEWDILKGYYESPYFFSSKVIKQNAFFKIELNKVYRQTDEKFISILNQIRNGQADESVLQELNSKYIKDSKSKFEQTITLTTHNYQADKINQAELSKISAKSFVYKAEIEGEISEKNISAEKILELKEGARVMFIRNDSDIERRYYNGKLGTVKLLTTDSIIITPDDSETDIEVKKEKWSNVRYVFDKSTNSISEDEIGSFTQFPLRLAWAVTIHKSQGLTFDNVVIDAGSAFASGQVYVALSRCRTLEGIKLTSKLSSSNIKTDKVIIDFCSIVNSELELTGVLEKEKFAFLQNKISRLFHFEDMIRELQSLTTAVKESKSFDDNIILNELNNVEKNLQQLEKVSASFVQEVDKIILSENTSENVIEARLNKAQNWFGEQLESNIYSLFQKTTELLKNYPRVSTLKKKFKKYSDLINLKIEEIEGFRMNGLPVKVTKNIEQKTKPKKKAIKGSSAEETIRLHSNGNSIEEIAQARGMARSTIESHLAEAIERGEIHVSMFMDMSSVDKIIEATGRFGVDKLSPLKEYFGDEFTYSQLRFVLNHLNRLKAISEEI